jgi:hypothetical protein
MKTYQVELYVERGEDEMKLLVSGTVSPYVRAITHLAPENCSPAEGGEVEITSITDRGMVWKGELTEKELEQAEEELFEAAQRDDDFGPEDDDDDFGDE